MPYIDPKDRPTIEFAGLENLCGAVPEMTSGELTYIVYRLLTAWCASVPRFSTFAEATGAVAYAIVEFNRRVVAPYEDAKRAENGDV